MTVWPDGTKSLPYITSPYGDPRPGNENNIHNGVDFIGFKYIKSVEAGRVLFAGWNSLMGNITYTSHAGDSFRSRSCHMSGKPPVQYGQWISEGTTVGAMGDTGTASDGTHLHFDIYLPSPNGWYRVDPVAFLRNRMGTTAGGGSTPFPNKKEVEDEMAYRAKSSYSKKYYIIPELAPPTVIGAGAPKSANWNHAIAYSHSADRSFPVLPSSEIQAMLDDNKARRIKFFTEQAEALGLKVQQTKLDAIEREIAGLKAAEENEPEPLTADEIASIFKDVVTDAQFDGLPPEAIAEAIEVGVRNGLNSLRVTISASEDGS